MYFFKNITDFSLKINKLLLDKRKAIKPLVLHLNPFFSLIIVSCTDVYCSYPYYLLFGYFLAKKKKTLVSGMREFHFLFFFLYLIEFFK